MNIAKRLYLGVALSLWGLSVTSNLYAGQLQIGTSRVDISHLAYMDGTPPENRTHEHEWLYMRAIVLDNGETKALFLSADMSGIRPDEAYQRAAPVIAREFDIPVENMILAGTHTHGGPRELRDADKTYAAILQTVRAAHDQFEPVSIGFGEGSVNLNVNRDAISPETRLWTQAANLDGPSDKTLAVLAFFNANGRPVAGLMNYAMHPVGTYLAGFKGADFPGAAMHHIEQAFDGDMVMLFTQGASGDQNPLHLRTGTNVMAAASGVEVTGFELTRERVEARLREGVVDRSEDNPALQETLKRWMDAQGQVIGEEAIRVMTRMDRLASDVKMEGQMAELRCPGRARIGYSREGSPGTYEDGPDSMHRLGVLGINEIVLASASAEIYSVIGRQVRSASPLGKTMFVTAANGKSTSYTPTDDAYTHNTFQVVGSEIKPGCAQRGIVENITHMIYDYMR